jgi:hypothetical protein
MDQHISDAKLTLKKMVKVFTGLVNFCLLHISIGLLNYINFVGF